MENYNTGGINENLKLDQQATGYLREARGWAMFLAILGFIGVAFMVIAALVMFAAGPAIGTQFGFPVGMLGLLYLVMAVGMVLPPIFLLGFAQKAGNACESGDAGALTESLKNLRTHFKIKGILYILLIALYIIIIIAAVLTGIGSML
ncbi:MAG: hypothetical protein JXB34_09950 [Bacteroidales bacterium]|nr:hypothetical protein [Bacteroidales bacterium]